MTTTIKMGTGSTVMACDDSNGSMAFWTQSGGKVGEPPASTPTGPPDVMLNVSTPEAINIIMSRMSKMKEVMIHGEEK